MNKPVGGNVNLRQKVAIHKKVPLLICPSKKLQGLTWERLGKINLETYHCAKRMPNFCQFQTQRSQSIQLMPAEKQIIRWYGLLICVSYETYDSRIISKYVWRYCVKLCFHLRSSLSWINVYVSPSHTAGKSKGFVKELADNFNKQTMNAMQHSTVLMHNLRHKWRQLYWNHGSVNISILVQAVIWKHQPYLHQSHLRTSDRRKIYSQSPRIKES